MGYKQIKPTDIFVYRAVDNHLKDRIFSLPFVPGLIPEFATGIPQVDERMKREAMNAIDWATVPERRESGCLFMDAFAALVHRYGFKRMGFYAKELAWGLPPIVSGKKSVRQSFTAEEVNNTIHVLSGMTGPEWVTEYTLLMVWDLTNRVDLFQHEIASQLHFTTPMSFSQFMRNYGSDWKKAKYRKR